MDKLGFAQLAGKPHSEINVQSEDVQKKEIG